MVKRVCIHIGPHKTGSTYIQKMLVQHRQQLLNHSYDYSTVGQTLEYGHHRIAADLYSGRYEVVAETLRAALSTSYDTLLLSSENFDRLSVADVAELKNILGDFEVRLVYVKRDPVDLLLSSWQEDVKHGSQDDWGRYFFPHIIRPFVSPIINPCFTLDKFSAYFQRSQIRIIDYDRAKLANADLFAEFLKAIGLDELPIFGTRELVNASMSYDQVEVIRLLNILATADGLKVTANVRSAYLDCIRAQKNTELIAFLHSEVRRSSTQFTLQDSYLFKSVQKRFIDSYGDLIFGANETKPALRGVTTLLLPHTSWYASPLVTARLETLLNSVREFLPST